MNKAVRTFTTEELSVLRHNAHIGLPRGEDVRHLVDNVTDAREALKAERKESDQRNVRHMELARESQAQLDATIAKWKLWQLRAILPVLHLFVNDDDATIRAEEGGAYVEVRSMSDAAYFVPQRFGMKRFLDWLELGWFAAVTAHTNVLRYKLTPEGRAAYRAMSAEEDGA